MPNKVHRKGVAAKAKQANKRHRRNCRSAPAVPTGLTVDFRRREMGKRTRWRAHVDWNPVTEDVGGRAINVETYEVQLRASDMSGDPVETALQAEALRAQGEDFTVHAGSAPVHTTDPKQASSRELNASPDEIKKTLTGLSIGLPVQVNFYAMEDTDGAAPRLKFEIWNVTDGITVASKNETLSGTFPKVYATRTFTPTVGKTYEARVSWVSGTGKGLLHHIQWHEKGNEAVWRRWTSADDEPTETDFVPLARPKTWFYQARVRTMNRTHGHRCWSAWSAWTTPTNPGHGTLVGPPPPTGLTQVIDKVEGTRRKAWRIRARWNESPWWIPPDDDAQAGADRYIVQLAVSNNGGTSTANVRQTSIPGALDSDGNATAQKSWLHKIHGKRHYRSRVRAVAEGRYGAWSAWTAWDSPGGAPNPVTGLTWSNPTPAILRAKWDDPTDPSDIDRYRVRVFRNPGLVLVEDAYVYGNRFTYHIPAADRTNGHRVRVNGLEEEISLDEDDVAPAGYSAGDAASDVETADVTATATWTSAEAPPSDGIVPSSHPAATVQGGPGWILAKWTAISNADAVTYDVYISATDLGSTVAAWTATTKVGSIDGTLHFITKLGTGAALAYGTTYFVAVIAKDRDGTATAALPTRGSAAMVKIPTVDVSTGAITANEVAANTLTAGEIAANAITASEIAANAVTAAKLEATLVIANMFKAVGGGGRMELDSAGLRLYNAVSGGTNTVNLKSSDGSAWFKGEIRTTNDNPLLRTTGFPRVKLVYSGAGSVPQATDTFVKFGTLQTDDLDGFWPVVSDGLSTTPDGTFDLTLPFAGQYLITMRATFATGGGARRDLLWTLNGAGGERISNVPVGGVPHRMQSTTLVDADAADTWQFGVFQNSGAGLTLSAAGVSIIYFGDA